MTHRGEYKTPGGKLVVIEFDILGEAIRNVVLTGDFFLYPEEALPFLVEALEGTPLSATSDEIAFRIRAILNGSAELVGATPEGVAIAVSRGLASPSESRSENG